jgi:hypothetical protein
MPKAPKIARQPNTPTQASFITRGTMGTQQNRGGPTRPLNPVVGSSRSNVSSPSLLGGM